MKGTGAVAALVLVLAGVVPGAAQAPPASRRLEGDALMAAARRAADAWRRHDFAALVSGSPGVIVRIRGTEPAAPLSPQQAALTLQAFAGEAEEVRAVVGSVREVDAGRGYAELERTYVAKGTSARRTQTLYLAWRRSGGAERLVEIRVLP